MADPRRIMELDELRSRMLSSRLPQIIDSVPTALLMIDRSGCIVMANAQTEILFGHPLADLRGRPVDLLVPARLRSGQLAEDKHFFIEPDARHLGAAGELVGLRRDGSEFPIEIALSPIAIEDDLFVLSATDLTERKRLEHDLRQANKILEAGQRELERLKQALDAHALVAITDRDGSITYVNERFCAISGYASSELLGQNHRMLTSGHHPLSFFVAMYATITDGRVWHGEILNRAKDGSTYWVDTTIMPFIAKDGDSERYIAIRTDITAQKSSAAEAQAQRQIAESANRVKGDFLAVMSHEIRTPLNGVLGLVGMLLQSGLQPSQAYLARNLQTCGEALLTLVNDILDFSKIEAGVIDLQEEDFGLRHSIDDTITLMAERILAKDLELSVVIEAGVPDRLRGDQSRLRQILANLLSNAVKFTQAGGIRIRVSMLPALSTDGAEVVRLAVSVADSGIGIQAENLKLLFTPFTQINRVTSQPQGGTGLGLTIARMLVERMGGSIHAESVLGIGTIFRFNIGFVRGVSSASAEETDENRQYAVTALVAVHGNLLAQMMVEQLGIWGFMVQTCPLAEVASVLHAAIANGRPPRLIIKTCLAGSTTPSVDLMTMAKNAGVRILSLCRPGQLGCDADLPLPAKPAALHRLLHELVTGVALPEPPESTLSRLTGHVLIAEDNPVNQIVMLDSIRRLGLSADLAANGQEAIEAVARRAYDLVLMDCQMPIMNGIQATIALRRLEAQYPDRYHLPIVALTAGVTDAERQVAMQAGMDAYLTKPIRQVALHAMLSRWLARGMQPTPDGVVAEAPANVVPVVDEGDAERFARLRQRLSEEHYLQLLTAVQSDLPASLSRLDDAVRFEDHLRAGQIAHYLRSTANALGHVPLAEVCSQLEAHAKKQEVGPLSESHQRLQALVAACLQALPDACSQPPIAATIPVILCGQRS